MQQQFCVALGVPLVIRQALYVNLNDMIVMHTLLLLLFIQRLDGFQKVSLWFPFGLQIYICSCLLMHILNISKYVNCLLSKQKLMTFFQGAVGLRMRVYDRIMCFVNCHFTAHLETVNCRNADFDHVYWTMSFSRPTNLFNAASGTILYLFLFSSLVFSMYLFWLVYRSGLPLVLSVAASASCAAQVLRNTTVCTCHHCSMLNWSELFFFSKLNSFSSFYEALLSSHTGCLLC